MCLQWPRSRMKQREARSGRHLGGRVQRPPNARSAPSPLAGVEPARCAVGCPPAGGPAAGQPAGAGRRGGAGGAAAGAAFGRPLPCLADLAELRVDDSPCILCHGLQAAAQQQQQEEKEPKQQGHQAPASSAANLEAVDPEILVSSFVNLLSGYTR